MRYLKVRSTGIFHWIGTVHSTFQCGIFWQEQRFHFLQIPVLLKGQGHWKTSKAFPGKVIWWVAPLSKLGWPFNWSHVRTFPRSGNSWIFWPQTEKNFPTKNTTQFPTLWKKPVLFLFETHGVTNRGLNHRTQQRDNKTQGGQRKVFAVN